MCAGAIVLTLSLASVCAAADVMYSLWEDENDNVWIRIENGLDESIKVESISLIFYNSKGTPVQHQQSACNDNCILEKHDVRDFGAYQKPDSAETCRVQKIRYAVQNGPRTGFAFLRQPQQKLFLTIWSER
jgi:hypothetical protein